MDFWYIPFFTSIILYNGFIITLWYNRRKDVSVVSWMLKLLFKRDYNTTYWRFTKLVLKMTQTVTFLKLLDTSRRHIFLT